MTTDREKHRNAGRSVEGPGGGTPDDGTRTAKWPRTIRTTMEPHREYLVEEPEYLDLKAQGLIKSEGE